MEKLKWLEAEPEKRSSRFIVIKKTSSKP
ncbi:hypothetical protein PBAL39_20379 [Pedobacter sp. BAL39]|nr:hypothetical protein PBAL39_20379 [Pedobacter sp. BAL39]